MISVNATTGTAGSAATARPTLRQLARLRWSSIITLALLLVQYGIGIAVNLYVTVPAADHGHGIGQAVANGPAGLSLHVVLGVALILAAMGVLAQAIIARHRPTIITSAIGLLAITGAAFAGSEFVSSDATAASMTMAVLTGVALACYAASLYLSGQMRRS